MTIYKNMNRTKISKFFRQFNDSYPRIVQLESKVVNYEKIKKYHEFARSVSVISRYARGLSAIDLVEELNDCKKFAETNMMNGDNNYITKILLMVLRYYVVKILYDMYNEKKLKQNVTIETIAMTFLRSLLADSDPYSDDDRIHYGNMYDITDPTTEWYFDLIFHFDNLTRV